MSCLGEILKCLRKKQELSLQDVATAADISKAHVWDLERGVSVNPTIETLCKLGHALKTDVTLLCSAAIADHGAHKR
jgi:transcriptional regulator with XRE-family HTH domain